MSHGATRRAVIAVGRNRGLRQLEAAYGLWSIYELAIWVTLLLWAFAVSGAAFAGALAVAQLIPAALLAPVGGVLCDKFARDVVLRLTYLAQAISTALVAILIATNAPHIAVVLIAVLTAVLIGWTRPSHYAAAADLSHSAAEAAAANSVSGVLERAGYFAGPTIAGALTAAFSSTISAAVCSASTLVCLLLLTGLRLPSAQAVASESAAKAPGRTRDLVRTLFRQPSLLVVLLVIGAAFVTEGCLELLAIAFATTHLHTGAATAGVLMSAEGFGGFFGAIGTVILIKTRRLSLPLAMSLVACGALLTPFALINNLLPAVIALALVGAALGFFSVTGITLMQRSVDDDVLAGVLGMRESAMLGGLAVGAALAPMLVRHFNAAGAYVALGLAVCAVALIAYPAVFRLDSRAKFRPDVLELLRGINFLGLLDIESLERLTYSAERVEVTTGSVVIAEGDVGTAYFAIESGSVAVTVEGEARVNHLTAGQGFGEIALLRAVRRTATITAETDCVLWQIERDVFLDVVAGSSGHDVADRHIDTQLSDLAPKSMRPVDED